MKLKAHFSRKDFIALGLIFFYGLTLLFVSFAIDGRNPFFREMNIVQRLASKLFPIYDDMSRLVLPQGNFPAYVFIALFVFYLVFISTALIYEYRLAKFYEEKAFSGKWIGIYASTVLIGALLWMSVSAISFSGRPEPFGELVSNCFLFLLESSVIGFLLFLTIFLIVINIGFIVINFKNIDKPFKLFDNEEQLIKELERKQDEQARKQGNLAASFALEQKPEQEASIAPIEAKKEETVEEEKEEKVEDTSTSSVSDAPKSNKEFVFPGLCMIDSDNEVMVPDHFEDDLNLNTLCYRFRNYLARQEGLYFSPIVVREFVAGMAASRFIILEGLSGTGKSSLARYFSEFISEKSFFEAVQATWRDRTSLIGYYNDFSRSYSETEFLKRLYLFTYLPRHVNIMVLDEMNISRIEYYFADFLSIMEYPLDDWKIKIMQLPYGFEAPKHLPDGFLKIPNNTYFIGTANKDESTFTITDKVYDRAITIDFDDRNEPFEIDGPSDKITLSYDKLQSLFQDALRNESYRLNAEDYAKLKKITDFTYEQFDLTFGNRIMKQIQNFVPVYVSCGGEKNEALDFMFSRKIIAKLEGRFEDYIRQGLLDLKALIQETYGENSFPQTIQLVDKLLRKL